MRRLVLAILPAALSAQPAFEVVSIKPWTSHIVGGVFTYPGGRVEFRGCTLEYLIEQAFEVQQFQISGGPGWLRSERYDIDTTVPESSPSRQSRPPYRKAPMNREQRQMLAALLADRFQLRYRRETREGPVYLLVKKNGPLHMTDSKDKNEFPWSRVSGAGMEGINESMPDLATRLSELLERPVLDKTGIAGSFDFHVASAPLDSERPDLTAVALACAEQLGLKLDTSRGPVDSIVVEGAEKPTAN